MFSKSFTMSFLFSGGSINRDAMISALDAEIAKETAFLTTDQDAIKADLGAVMRKEKNLTKPSVEFSVLVDMITLRRVTLGTIDGEDSDTVSAQKERITEVLGHFIEANPNQYLRARGDLVWLRYVDDDFVCENGEPVLDAEGSKSLRLRVSDAEWNALNLKKESVAASRAAKIAAKEAPRSVPSSGVTAKPGSLPVGVIRRSA